MDNSKLDFVDTLRGYAILGVVAVHSSLGKSNFIGSSLVGWGAKGVQLFYLMSAFTLMLSFKKNSFQNNDILNFYIRRIFRIIPMFYIAIITWIFLSSNNIYITNDYRYISLGSIFSHFLLLHGLNPNWQDSLVPGGWSVAVESIFYIFCPLFFRYITSLNKSIIFLTISIYIGSIITYLLNSLSIIPNDWKRE